MKKIEEYIKEIKKLTKRLKTATSFEELWVCSERLGLLNKKYLEKEEMKRGRYQ